MKLRRHSVIKLALMLYTTALGANQAEDGYCNVLFWPNKNFGFGHVALEVFRPGNTSKIPNTYISWANRNYNSQDMKFHQRDPKIVRLNNISGLNFIEFKDWFEKSAYVYPQEHYAQQYRFLRNNCAHAVARGIEALNFDVKKKPRRFALRPREVYRGAKKISKHN